MRIAYLADPGHVNAFYRSIGPMKHLADRGHEVRQLTNCKPHEVPAAISGIDIFQIHRYADKQTQRMMREAQQRGAAVVWDEDDDLASLPKSSIDYRRRGGLYWEHETVAKMKAVFGLAHLVTAPSAILTDRLRERGARHTTVIENHIPGLFLRPREHQARTGVTVGWVAGKLHQQDAQALGIRAALQRLLDERPDVHVVTVGLGLGLGSDRYRHIDSVHILDLANRTATFDVGIAPLADTPFNEAKSNVKLKEYAAGGTPWLASPVGPYAGMGEKQGGRLVPDDRWHEEISRLIDRPKDRRKLAKNGTRWVAGETLERTIGHWEDGFAEAIEHARAQRHHHPSTAGARS
jgi:glycosyltransferase involved in cell wall biosynthesis